MISVRGALAKAEFGDAQLGDERGPNGCANGGAGGAASRRSSDCGVVKAASREAAFRFVENEDISAEEMGAAAIERPADGAPDCPLSMCPSTRARCTSRIAATANRWGTANPHEQDARAAGDECDRGRA